MEDSGFYELSCVNQVSDWDFVEDSESLYRWQHTNDRCNYRVDLRENCDGYSVDYFDRDEISTGLMYNWGFETEEAAFLYALELMENIEEL